MQEEHCSSAVVFGQEPKKKRRWRKKEPDPHRRFRPRRKEASDTSKAKGEYTTQKMLAVMAHIAGNGIGRCTVREIARGAKIYSKAQGRFDPDGTGRILRKLAKRCLIEKNGGKKKPRIIDPDIWTLTVAGNKHLYTELRARYYTPMIESLVADGDWKAILNIVVEIRIVIVPKIKALEPFGEHAYPVYRIDQLYRTRSIQYLRNALKYAAKAWNPCAHFVSSCIGKLWDCNLKRAEAWSKKRRFFVKHPELLERFLYVVDKPERWVDPFEFAQKVYDCVEVSCNTARVYTPDFVMNAAYQAANRINGPRQKKAKAS